MSEERVRDAYAARAAEYIDLFGSIERAADQDRRLVLSWAQLVDGPILDVGCGPGQWTAFLCERGVDAAGLDPVPVFIEHARRRFPGVDFRVGHAHRLGVDDGSLGGVLAWYSLIHTDPDEIGAALSEFARAVRPGGGVAIGFFEGPELAPFEHAVATAYHWPLGLLSSEVERAGFEVTEVRTRTEPGARTQGAMVARRRA